MRYLIAIAVAWAAASAEAQDRKLRPWDERPPKCFAPDAPQSGQCQPPESYPDAETVSRRVSMLYFNETYPQLERYLSELVDSKKRFPDGVYPEEVIFKSLVNLMWGSVDNGAGREGNAAWRKAVPESKFVTFADAQLLRQAAWNARGTGYASTVPKEAWELFAIRLQESEQLLLKLPPAARESPLWHMALLAASMDSNRAQSNPQEIFEAAVKRWPTYASFYQLVLNRMVPKWGGSWEVVEAFIVRANKMQPAAEGSSLYARLYVELNGECCAGESKFNWSAMKAGFEDIIVRFPDPMYKNRYASYACMAQDKAAFGQAMSKMKPDQIIPGWWLSGHSYQSCLRWAGT